MSKSITPVFLLTLYITASSGAINSQYNDQLQLIFEEVLSNPNQGRISAFNHLKHTNNSEETGLTYNILGLSYAIINRVDSALYYFDSACDQLPDSHPMVPRIYTNKAMLYRNNSSLEQAMTQLFKAERIANEQNNLKSLALVYGEYSSVYTLLSRNHEAIEYTLKAISLLEQEETEDITVAIEKQKLGNLYRKTNDFLFAQKIYDEILPIMKSRGKTDAYILTKLNYADIIQHFDGDSASISYLKQMESEIDGLKSPLLSKLYLSKLGKHLKNTDALKATSCLEKAVSLATENISTYSLSIITEYLTLLLKDKNYLRSSQLIDDFEPYLIQINFPLDDQIHYYNSRTLFYEATYNLPQAFKSLKIEQKLNDEKSELNNTILALEIQEKYKNDLLLNENKILNQSIEMKQRNSIITYISLIGVILISILIVKSSVQRRKNIEHQNTIIKEKLYAESELRSLQEKTIKEQKKEVLKLFNSNIRLNEQLSEVKKSLSTIDNKDFALEQLSRIEAKEENWEELIYKLRVVEKDFFLNLMVRFPTLTKKEIDFCALIRIGLEYKQIANVLHISHNSALTKKYRIVKKVNLEKDMDFQNWIMTI
jgi:tetratricopeptide (TPR) repeat protein